MSVNNIVQTLMAHPVSYNGLYEIQVAEQALKMRHLKKGHRDTPLLVIEEISSEL